MAACLPGRGGIANGAAGCHTTADCCDGYCVLDPAHGPDPLKNLCCGPEAEGCTLASGQDELECTADANPAVHCSNSPCCATTNAGAPLPCNNELCCSPLGGACDVANDCCFKSSSDVSCVKPGTYAPCNGTGPDCLCCVKNNKAVDLPCTLTSQCCDLNAKCHVAPTEPEGACCRDPGTACADDITSCCPADTDPPDPFVGEKCQPTAFYAGKTCCMNNAGTCAHNSDCCSGVCTNGSCVACVENSQCPANFYCDTGVCGSTKACNTVPGLCAVGADCCTSACGGTGHCSCSAVGGVCQSNPDCCGGNHCNSSNACCVPENSSGCTVDADCCTAGDTCDTGVCEKQHTVALLGLCGDTDDCSDTGTGAVCAVQGGVGGTVCCYPTGKGFCNNTFAGDCCSLRCTTATGLCQ